MGTLVDENFFEELEEKENSRKAFHSAISLLNYRMRSTAELRKRLAEKGYTADTIESVVQKLAEKKFLDDEVFAKAFINDKINSRLLGPVALHRELIPHKLDSELVEKLIQKSYDEMPEEKLVEQLIEKRRIIKGQKLTQKEKKRLLNFLQRKGHTWGVISVVFDKWLLETGTR